VGIPGGWWKEIRRKEAGGLEAERVCVRVRTRMPVEGAEDDPQSNRHQNEHG
jgi:hypothetical protein